MLYMRADPSEPTGTHHRIQGTILKGATGGLTGFHDLPITAALGYPLRIFGCPKHGLLKLNSHATSLYTDPNPKSSTFGQTLIQGRTDGTVLGGVLLVRCDGVHMHPLHLMALVEYISRLDEIHAACGRKAAGETLDCDELAARFLTPAAFASGFETIKQEMVELGHERWSLRCAASAAPALRASAHFFNAAAARAYVTAVITVAMRDQEYGFCLGGSVLADLNASSYQFEPLPITAALGLALAEVGSPTTSLPGVPNAAFECFSIDPDPKSPMFGRAMIAPGPPWGLLLVRQDGRHLHELHLMALLDYLQYDLREVINVKHKERAGEVADKEEIARRLLTPSAFSAAFEKTRTKEIAQGAKGWKELENPVKLGS
ncbi:hypothetical protein LTR56_005151 [Elasticomyces elasticus]|nr:hypothetical protein LTR56_005151 [Elasticomyces elasticus]KAK3659607.1 hypothetical protein LTR22_008337 [Elasticomyces elasticus]KAK4921309.1 hypothetical protein LTR49_011312 [Elasticomyces elasticus]KAK5759678.1 hypothetical protein LTS12_010195 [Elasticomyces elasticus]